MSEGDDKYGMAGAAWSGRDLILTDESKLARVRRDRLAPSTAQKFLQCPAAAVAARLMPRTEDPFGAAEIGTATHLVLELLMQLEPERRTREEADRLIRKVAAEQWALSKLKDRSKTAIRTNNENRKLWLAQIGELVDGYFAIEDPRTIQVVGTEWEIPEDIRVAHGPGVPDGVPVRGVIDRADRSEDGLLLLRDYKTGAFKKPSPMFGDEYGDQLRVYVAAVEAWHGVQVGEASLLYPRSRKTRAVDLSPGAREETAAVFRQAWLTMHRSADEQRFETRPSALCGWCPLVNVCPSAQVRSAKAKEAVARQPSAEDLAEWIPVLPAPGALVAISTPETGVQPPEPNMCVVEGAGQMTDEVQSGQRSIQVRPEAPAYEETVGKGELNLNSYAAMAVNGIVMQAFESLVEAGQPVNPITLGNMSKVLGGIVLRVQHQLTGQANFQRGANTRLRGLLAAFVQHRKPPFGEPEDAWSEWMARAERFLAAGMAAGLALHEDTDLMANDAHLYFASAPAPVLGPDDPGPDAAAPQVPAGVQAESMSA